MPSALQRGFDLGAEVGVGLGRAHLPEQLGGFLRGQVDDGAPDQRGGVGDVGTQRARYVGVGETIDDLVAFSADEYVNGLFEEKW